MSDTPLVPLGQMYAAAFKTFADRPAVRDGCGQLTYGELGERTRRLASALRDLAVSKGDRVVIVSPNSNEWATIERAIALAGFVRVSLLPRLHTSELAQIAADADPAIVLADADWLTRTGRDWIPSQVRHVVGMGTGELPDGVLGFDELVTSGQDEEMPVPDAE